MPISVEYFLSWKYAIKTNYITKPESMTLEMKYKIIQNRCFIIKSTWHCNNILNMHI